MIDKDRDTYWNTIQTVHINEAFPLFQLARNGTVQRQDDNGSFGGIASRIRLQTELPGLLNLSIVAAPYALQQVAVINPFDRSQGYPFDQEDFSLHRRYRKIASMKRQLAKIVEGLGLIVFVAYEDIPFNSPMRTFKENGEPSLPPEITSLIEHLFLTLTFPGGSSFTARALCHTNRLFLLFRTFFPTDTGPLPVGDSAPEELSSLNIEEGFRILLPFDAEKVQAIRAKFLILPNTL